MTFPSMLLALMISLLFGVLYYVVRGGSGGWFFLCLGLSVAGFAIGIIFGMWRGWMFFMLGSMNLGMGILGSVLFLGAGDWLSHASSK